MTHSTKYDPKAQTRREPDQRQPDWKRDRYEQRKLKSTLRDRSMKGDF